MRFEQYATGRAPKMGYGFLAETQNLAFKNGVFYSLRQIMDMGQGERVFEIHPVDKEHSALVMTQVAPYGGGNICYTNALISAQSVSPELLLPLLRAENFLSTEAFLALEGQIASGEQFQPVELELPSEPATAPALKALASDVLDWLRGYLWSLSAQQNANPRAGVTPAMVRVPQEWSVKEMTAYFSEHVLSRLPEKARRGVSIVFGAPVNMRVQFPATTCCFVTHSDVSEYAPSFDLTTGEVRGSAQQLPPVMAELGRYLAGGKIASTYQEMIQALGADWEASYPFAMRVVTFHHATENENESTMKRVQLAQTAYLQLYRMLGENDDARAKLRWAEQRVLMCWHAADAREETPPELYEKLVENALSLPPDGSELWQLYLKALVSKREPAQRALSGCDCWFKHQRMNPERYAEFVRAALERGCTQAQIWQLLQQTEEEIRKAYGLDKLIMESLCANPTKEDVRFLCDLCQKRLPPPLYVKAMLDCAEKVALDEDTALRLAEVIQQLPPELLDAKLQERVVRLFNKQYHAKAIRKLLGKLTIDYRSLNKGAERWLEVDNSSLWAMFQNQLETVSDTKTLRVFAERWSKLCESKHIDWKRLDENHAFREAPEKVSEQLTRLTSALELKTMCELSKTYVGEDWFDRCVRKHLKQTVRNQLPAILQNGSNAAELEKLPKLMEKLGLDSHGIQELKTIGSLCNMPRTHTGLMRLLIELHNDYPTGIPGTFCALAREHAGRGRGDTFETSMLLCLMRTLGAPSQGWMDFFQQQQWMPEYKMNPWEDGLYLLNALHYTANKLVQSGADLYWRETLRSALVNDESWGEFLQKRAQKKHSQFELLGQDGISLLTVWLGIEE